MVESTKTNPFSGGGVPEPIVRLNRWTLVAGIAAGLVFQQPLFTTILFFVLLAAVLGGRHWSLIYRLGKVLLASRIEGAEQEDPRLMRFNNTIAIVLLGSAQAAFLAGVPFVGWILSAMVAVAAGIALAGFCVGCFLYYQLKMYRYRLSAK